MEDYDDITARRNASEAVVPAADTHDERGDPYAKSDRGVACRLREGHRVHFVAVADGEEETPEVRELHCADPHCDHHVLPESVNETVSVDTEETHVGGAEPYEDADSVYAGEAVLLADFEGEEPRLGLTDVKLATYAETRTIPTV